MLLGEQGRVVLPRELRARMGLSAGDQLSVSETNEGIVLKPVRGREAVLEDVRRRWRATGATLDDLFREREREAALERKRRR